MDEPLTHEHFSAHVGKRFGFEGSHLMLLLRSAEPRPSFVAVGSKRVPFVLIFEGPAGDILPTGYYRATVEDGPAFELHIMPIHTYAPDRQDYQVVFN
jgi:hypothetical protein